VRTNLEEAAETLGGFFSFGEIGLEGSVFQD